MTKKIKLKDKSISRNSFSYVKDYLINSLGIKNEEVNSFLNIPQNSDELQPELLINSELAVKTTYELMKDGAKVFVQVDSDCDGYTSAAILVNYLKKRFPQNEIVWRLHKEKEHGVIVDTVPEDCNLVFIPDAGSNQFEEQKQLIAKGKTVIILDHHEVSDFEETGAIVVNNQLSPNFPNKYLSGAGVVYKFIKLFDRMYFDDKIYKDYGDLAAIGIVGDVMDMRNLDNNYIAYHGLLNINNRFIKELIAKRIRSIKNPNNLTKIEISFYIVPIINGVIRSGTEEDKKMVFWALTDENNTDIFEREWRGSIYTENLYESAARLASNAKSRQDSAKKKAFTWLCEKIREKELDKNNIIIVTLDEKESIKVMPTITGLIAMELVKEFNKPTLVLRETYADGKKVYGGSGRNGIFAELPDLKGALKDANVSFAEGHPNAFGAYLLPEEIDNITNYFNKSFDKNIFEDTTYDVDYWFKENDPISKEMMEDFAEYEHLWGTGMPEPKFAFSKRIQKNNVFIMGADKQSVRIKIDGIDFVCFKNSELVNLVTNIKDSIYLDIVGKVQMNEWLGNRNPQVIIEDYIIAEEPKQRPSLLSLI